MDGEFRVPPAVPDKQMVLSFDSPMRGRVQNDRRMAIWNFFEIDHTKKSMVPMRFSDGRNYIVVQPSRHGMANLADKDLLIYLCSLIIERVKKNGAAVSAVITFTAGDYLSVTSRMDSGGSYKYLKACLRRLRGTEVETDIITGSTGVETNWNWLSDYRINYRTDDRGGKVMESVTVTMCEWLFRAVLEDASLLTYSQKYFDLPPLSRRLYEIARAHISDDEHAAAFPIAAIHGAVGSLVDLRRFKYELTKIRGEALPQYRFEVVSEKSLEDMRRGLLVKPKRVALENVLVVFWHKDKAASLEAVMAIPDLSIRKVAASDLPKRLSGTEEDRTAA